MDSMFYQDKILIDMIDTYHADGVVYHPIKSCRTVSTGLADNRPEGAADGREWRTAPLWGVGLAKTVNPRATFLHDGRARTLLEAILWHGGEAEAAKDKVVSMSKAERDALLAFLGSL